MGENQDEVKRLKEEIEAMKKQQNEMLELLKSMQEQNQPKKKKKTSLDTIEEKRQKWERKAQKYDERVRSFEEKLEGLDDVIENFVTSILESVAESMAKSTEHIFSDTDLSLGKRKIRIEKIGKTFKYKVRPEELDDFAEKMSSMLSPLMDPHRIKILKALEKAPKYHDEISEFTGTKGGQFKHHMTILMEKGFVLQERYRGRYILTKTGRSFLKMLEVLYVQAKIQEEKTKNENTGDSESNDDVSEGEVDIPLEDQDRDEREEAGKEDKGNEDKVDSW